MRSRWLITAGLALAALATVPPSAAQTPAAQTPATQAQATQAQATQAQAAASPAASAAGAKDMPDVVVLYTANHSETVTVSDLPLILSKLKREERALVRRALFVSGAVSRTRPAKAPEGSPESCSWSFQAFLQRQVCISSMTGLFACTEADVMTLPEETDGEVILTREQSAGNVCGDAFPDAATARSNLVAMLRGSAQSLFDNDEKLKVDPIFKAAGVATRPGRVAQ